MTLQALQLDREKAVHTLFYAKQALNRAAHAGAQQLDPARLAAGEYAIDAAAAERKARAYLQANLQLDAALRPLPGAYLDAPVEWLVFDVVSSDRSFPYLYEHETYDFRVVLNRPGVVMMVRVEYPRTYAVFPPIAWVVKGVAELTVP
jgi:hypothetical protein